MRKRVQTRKFGRERAQRDALFSSLISELFMKERIKTTEAKAKEMRKKSEKMITVAKKGGLPAQRRLLETFSKTVTKKLITDIAPKYKDRQGGYTRVIKLGPRASDGARMAFIELV